MVNVLFSQSADVDPNAYRASGLSMLNTGTDGDGNIIWNNTAYRIKVEFTNDGNHDAYAIYYVCDENGNDDYTDDDQGSAYVNNFGTGSITQYLEYWEIDDKDDNYDNEGKTFRVRVDKIDSDNSGNNQTIWPTGTFIYRRTPPTTPGTPDLVADYDSGLSDTDNITNQTTLNFTTSSIDVSGTDYSFCLFDGEDGWGDGQASFLTPFVTTTDATPTISGVSGFVNNGGGDDNVYYVRVIVKNQYGSVAESGRITVDIDTDNPSQPSTPILVDGSDTGRSDDDHITSEDTPQFLQYTSGGNWDSVNDRIQYFFNDTYTTIDDSTPGRTDRNYDYLYTSGALASGDGTVYEVQARIVDVAGNVSEKSSALTITVDTEAPDAPSTPDLDAAFDTGNLSTDNVTNLGTGTDDIEIIVTGVTEGDSVRLYSGADAPNGTWLKSAIVENGQTSVTFTDRGLSTGTANITAIAYDAAGNASSASSAMSLTIDTEAPNKPTLDLKTSSDLGYIDNDDITSDNTPTLTFANLANLDSVVVYNGGDRVQADISDGASINVTLGDALSDGDHVISVIAKDPAGNESTVSDNLTITIDTAPPVAPNQPDLKEGSDTGFTNSDNYTSDNTPEFAMTGLTATDSIVISIGFVQDFNQLATDVAEDITTPVAVNDGTYNVTAVAYDLAGNVSNTSSALSITIDTSVPPAANPPDLANDSDTGRQNDDEVTNAVQPQFTVANVEDGDSLYLVFQNQADNSKDTTARVLSTGTTATLTSSDVTAATYNVWVSANDQAGNTTEGSALNPVVFDFTAPNAPSTPDLVDGSDSGLLNDDNLTSDQTPSFLVAGVTSGDSIVVTVGGENSGAVATGNNINLTIGTNLASNTYSTIVAKAIDLAGNESDDSNTLSVIIDATKPNAPATITIIPATDSGFDDTDAITKNQQPQFTIGGVDGTNRDSIEIIFDETFIKGGRVAAAQNTIELGPDTDQSASTPNKIDVVAVAIDSAGNVSDTSDVLLLEIDRTAPDQPNLPDLVDASDLGRINSDNITSDNTPTFSIGGLTQNDSIYVLFDTDTLGRFLATAATTEITIDNSIADGTYSVKVHSIDPAGNLSQASTVLTNVTIDATLPDAPTGFALKLASDSGISTSDALTNDATPTFVVSGVSNTDSVYVNIDNVHTVSDIAIANSIELTIPNALASGNYNVNSVRVDLAGNESVASNAVALRIDTQEPVTPNAPDLLAEFDGGFDNLDNITNASSPMFDLTGLSNTKDSLRLLIDGALATASMMSQTTRDSLEILNLTNGSYDISLVAIDSAGNISDTSNALRINIDVVQPSTPSAPDLITAKDTGESSTDNLTNDPIPSMETVNLESGTIIKLFSVSSSNDTTEIAVDTVALASTDITLTSDVTLADDTYTFYVTSEDTAGNQSESNDLTDVRFDTNVPTAAIVPSDSLIRMEDSPITITVTFDDGMSANPLIAIDFAGDDDLATTDMANTANDSIWTYDLTIPEGNDGTAIISIVGSDNAGNSLTDLNTTGRQILRVDNTDPVFTDITPDSTNYVNHRLVSYQLSEDVFAGTITWTRVSGNADLNSPHSQNLTPAELIGGTLFSNIVLADDPTELVSGTSYNLTFSATDSAGNQSLDYIETPVHYDTTAPTASLTYSKYIASVDTVVTITATFDERVLPAPQIAIDYQGVGDDISATNMTIGVDSTIWTYDAIIPAGEGNNGIASVSITTTDLALNALRGTDISNSDTLVVDNTLPSISLSYNNLTQAQLTNEGKYLDLIEVTAQFSEKANTAVPPVLNVEYADSTDDSFVNMSAFSSSNDDSVWVYQLTLPDSSNNDGLFTATLTAKDLAGNIVTTFTNNQEFTVDNTPPIDFNTGTVSPLGDNQVTGWYNSTTDSVDIQTPVPIPESDNSILLGGRMDIQMFNIVRGSDWVTIPSQDSIQGTGINVSFYRTKAEIESVLIPETSLIQGDTLLIRAVMTDRVGNTTNGDTSLSRLVYDPFPPTIGTVDGLIFFTQDTIVSSDSISATWSEFTDSVFQSIPGSGLSSYDYKIQHYDAAGTFVDNLQDWTTLALNDNIAHSDLALTHDNQYSLHVRATDVAGNISTIMNSDTIRRINSAPIITIVTDTINAFEDILFSQTIQFTDADTATISGDAFTYELTTTHQYGHTPATPAAFLTGQNVINWTPTQSDTGLYTAEVIVNDNWTFSDTISYSLLVTAVNDTPTVVVLSPHDSQTMAEDQTAIVKFKLSQYGSDVDNDSTELSYQVAVLDTSNKPGYPTTASLFFGEGTPPIVKQRLIEQFNSQTNRGKDLFSDDNKESFTPDINQIEKGFLNIQSSRSQANYIQVQLTDTTGVWWAEFKVDSNYYGNNHRIIFFVSDPAGATAQDTILLSITAENDPPRIATIPRFEVTENQFKKIDFSDYITDVDDTTLTIRVAALTYNDKMTITTTTAGATMVGDSLQFTSSNVGDTVLFTPEIEWSDSSLIHVSVIDGQNVRASTTFAIDILRVPRPNLSLEVIQNNAFTNYFEVVVTDTLSKTDSLFITIQGQRIPLDTVASYTYVGHYSFDNPGTYSFYVKAWGVVGDTTITRSVNMALARAFYDWSGSSPDGKFTVYGTSGSVSFDQSLLIVDSTMFNQYFHDKASYRLGNDSWEFDLPVEVSMRSISNDLAIYQRQNGVEWVELPSITEYGQVKAYTNGMGYFRLGHKTIIVPGQTSLHQNYPNPFNPTTAITYDVGFYEGPRQRINVSVYNILGQHVRTLVNEHKDIGRYTIYWNGKDDKGLSVSSGVYFVRMMNNHGRINTKKMMLVR